MDPYDQKAVQWILKSGLGAVPYIGSFLSGFISWIWPSSGPDIWNEIKEKVEALIEKDINAEVYNRLKASLNGLEKVMKDYEQVVQDNGSDKNLIVDSFNTCKDILDDQLPSFKEKGNELLLLPFLAPVVDMKLGLLRDAILYGKDWGLSDKYIADLLNELKSTIKTNAQWVDDWFRFGFGQSTNGLRFHREMTLAVKDHVSLWPYFVPSINPGGNESAIPPLTREVFSNGIGYWASAVEKFRVYIFGTYQWNRQRIRLTGIRIWADANGIHALQISNGGKWRKQDGILNSGRPTWETSNDVSNPIVRITGSGKPFKNYNQKKSVNTLQFHFADGTKSQVFGGKAGPEKFDWSVEGHVVRNLYMDDECQGLFAGFSYPDAVYDNTAPLISIGYTGWDKVGTTGFEPANGLRSAIESALDNKARLVWPNEVVAAWEKAELDQNAFCLLGDNSFALPLQNDTNDHKRGPNIDIVGGNQGYLHTPLLDVFFHQAEGLSRQEADQLCAASGWRLASLYEVTAAWQYLDLNVFKFGRIWDDRFVRPIQKKQANVPRGVNITLKPRLNQGFFYVLDVKA